MSAPNLISPTTLSGGTPVGGTGTTNTIPRWTGPSTLGDSALVQSGTNAVGFGTPKTWGTNFTLNAIQLSESASLSADINTTYLAANQYWDSPGFQNRRIKANFAARYLLNGATGDHQFQIAPFGAADSTITWTTAMTILNTSGNVGIGTASPASAISANATVLAVAAPGGNLGTVRVSNTSSFSGNHAELFASTTGVGVWGSSNCPMLFVTNNSERARIDSAGNVGIGTASPTAYAGYTTLAVNNATNGGLIEIQKAGAVVGYINGVSGMLFLATGANQATIGTAGAGSLVFRTNAADVARIDSAGRLLQGTSATPTSAEIALVTARAGNNGGQQWVHSGTGGCAIIPISGGGGIAYTFANAVGAESYGEVFRWNAAGNLVLNSANVGCTIQAAGTSQGLKLPATPGNADTQTLDCYQEGTWVPTLAGFGGTNPTVTASYTRVGRLVTIAVQIDATGGNQYSMTLGTTTITTPAGMTASSICAVPVVDGGVANRGIASVWTTGIIYLPTVALTTASTFFVATYRV